MSAEILGMGMVSAAGCGIAALKCALEGNIRPVVVAHEIETPDGMVALPVYTAEPAGLERFVPRASLRRMDRFTRMALLSSCLALEDAGLDQKGDARVGIVFGSGYGPIKTTFDFLDTLIDYGDKGASPTLFANSVHNSLASQVSISLKMQGPCTTLTCFNRTASAVFSTALGWLDADMVDYVLAGAGDEYCAVRGYVAAMSGGRDFGGIRPFLFDECTYLPGEGFVAFMLGRAGGQKGYCTLLGAEVGRGVPGGLDALFPAANGEAAAGRSYGNVSTGQRNVAAWSPLYGGMPVGNAFDTAIAALSLREGRLYPVPDASGGGALDVVDAARPLAQDAVIGCVECDAFDNYSLIRLSR